MNLPPQPASSEEPEQQPTLHSSEETPTAPVSDALSEETDQSPVPSPEPLVEETEQQPVSSSDALAEETDQSPVPSPEPSIEASEQQPVSSSELLTEETEQQPVSSSEPLADEASVADEDEAFAPAQPVAFSPQPARPGVFIHKGLLIAGTCAVVAVVLLASLLVFVNRPQDPPTDWIASYTPAASVSSTGKILYYLHWTNQNGKLTGQLQLAAKTNGTLQSLTASATGLYDRDNHIIYMVITIDGQPGTLTGTIDANNDTLTLNQVGATDQSSELVFHTGSANDYKQATKKL